MIDELAMLGTNRLLFLGLLVVAAPGASLLAVGGLDGVFGGLLALLMIMVAIGDAKRHIIPNELTAAAVALALLRAGIIGVDPYPALWVGCRVVATTMPFVLLMLGYRHWRGRDGLGFGDIKLAAVAGAWLDWITILAVIEAATLSALGAYIFISYIRGRRMKATAFLPFGAFLAPAIWIGWLAEALLG